MTGSRPVRFSGYTENVRIYPTHHDDI